MAPKAKTDLTAVLETQDRVLETLEGIKTQLTNLTKEFELLKEENAKKDVLIKVSDQQSGGVWTAREDQWCYRHGAQNQTMAHDS